MNRIGIYYAYWTRDWDADFLPFVARVKRLGFGALEVNAGTVARMTDEARKRLVDEAASQDIELSYCVGLPHEFDVAAEDRQTRERGIRYLRDQAAAIGKMGGGKLSGIIYSSWPSTLPPGEEKAPFVERSIASVREGVKSAEDNNVVFNVEVVNRFEQFILNTAGEAVEYVRAIGSPNCKMLLDTFHMNIEEDSMGDAIREAGTLLGHLHLGESNRKPPGLGHIPWKEVSAALKAIGYTGSVVMEPFLLPGGEVGRDIKVWRPIMPGADLDQEAAKSCRFMKEVLK
ncbi:MAG TPA: sugar phosphate isomerase/epimerase [Spirochaetia bacterium]|nr:sugar phosphate isomerase/epimerase [Spirochaetia bacterium]